MKRMATFLLIICLALAGCAAKNGDSHDAVQADEQTSVLEGGVSSALQAAADPVSTGELDLDDYDDDEPGDKAQSDPLEGWNRFWFRVNDCLM